MRYKALLFDLDGTLTASGEGITKSVQYALQKMGKGALGEHLEALEVFVGPPLLSQFMVYAGFSEEEAKEAVKYYRERYTVTGIFENRPYEGIAELLGKLQAKGYLLAVASSKPDSMVKIVLEHKSRDFSVVLFLRLTNLWLFLRILHISPAPSSCKFHPTGNARRFPPVCLASEYSSPPNEKTLPRK